MRALEDILASKPALETAKAGKKLSTAARKRNDALTDSWRRSLSKEEVRAYDEHCMAQLAASAAAFNDSAEGKKYAAAFERDFLARAEAAKTPSRISRAQAEEMAEDMGDYSHHYSR